MSKSRKKKMDNAALLKKWGDPKITATKDDRWHLFIPGSHSIETGTDVAYRGAGLSWMRYEAHFSPKRVRSLRVIAELNALVSLSAPRAAQEPHLKAVA
jgi:hypothetical protein